MVEGRLGTLVFKKKHESHCVCSGPIFTCNHDNGETVRFLSRNKGFGGRVENLYYHSACVPRET